MVVRQIGAWARWCLIIGLAAPLLGYFWIKDYDPSQSFYVNAISKEIEVPFSYGQNPMECLTHSIRTMFAEPLRMNVEPNYFCNLHTRIDYLNILFIASVLLVCGLYGFIRRQEFANLWPTEWTVHSPSSVQKNRPDVKVELDRNIKGEDAGF